LLTPAEVAALFRVDPKTVTRWAKAGKLSAIRTLGGHRRYRAAEVYALLEGLQVEPPETPTETPGPLGPSGVSPTENNTPQR
jgi:excisionase family DNA binding protein